MLEHLPLVQVVIPGSWDGFLAGSLLLPLPMSLPLSVSLMNKSINEIFFKKEGTKKIEEGTQTSYINAPPACISR